MTTAAAATTAAPLSRTRLKTRVTAKKRVWKVANSEALPVKKIARTEMTVDNETEATLPAAARIPDAPVSLFTDEEMCKDLESFDESFFMTLQNGSLLRSAAAENPPEAHNDDDAVCRNLLAVEAVDLQDTAVREECDSPAAAEESCGSREEGQEGSSYWCCGSSAAKEDEEDRETAVTETERTSRSDSTAAAGGEEEGGLGGEDEDSLMGVGEGGRLMPLPLGGGAGYGVSLTSTCDLTPRPYHPAPSRLSVPPGSPDGHLTFTADSGQGGGGGNNRRTSMEELERITAVPGWECQFMDSQVESPKQWSPSHPSQIAAPDPRWKFRVCEKKLRERLEAVAGRGGDPSSGDGDEERGRNSNRSEERKTSLRGEAVNDEEGSGRRSSSSTVVEMRTPNVRGRAASAEQHRRP